MTAARCRVSVRGYLAAPDLRRLERACAPALEFSRAPLDIDLDALSGLDEPARRFVLCLLHRGATLIGRRAAEWQRTMVDPATPSTAGGRDQSDR